MIDRQKLNSQLIQPFDKATLISVLDIFLNEYEGKMSNLRKSIAERNFGRKGPGLIGFDAHTIKSTSSYFFDSISEEYLVKLIKLDEEKVKEGLDETLALLEPAMLSLLNEVKDLRKEYSR
jgi:hypothetical protein